MADDETPQDAPGEPRQRIALVSGRGIGTILALLVLEGLVILAGVKMLTEPAGKTMEERKLIFITFDAVAASVSGPDHKSKHHYSLKPAVRVEEEHGTELTNLITRELAPIFRDRIQNRIQQVPAPPRKMPIEELRETLRKDLQAIFNRELLKKPKYMTLYKAELEEYEKQKKDPLTAGKAVYPGPVQSVQFDNFNFQ